MTTKPSDLCAFQNGKNEILLKELMPLSIISEQWFGGKKKEKPKIPFLDHTRLVIITLVCIKWEDALCPVPADGEHPSTNTWNHPAFTTQVGTMLIKNFWSHIRKSRHHRLNYIIWNYSVYSTYFNVCWKPSVFLLYCEFCIWQPNSCR